MTTYDRQPGKILIVDDQPANLQMIQLALEEKGHRVFAVTSGREALELAEKIIPDVVVLDILMPDLNGFETCHKLKEMSVLASIPVIFITARDDDEAMIQGYEEGGVDFIAQPFHKHELQLRVQCHLEIGQLKQEMLQKNHELQERGQQLREALANVKTLKSLLPICAHCKQVRDDQGYWQQIETYIHKHTDTMFSHGICPDCMRTYYPGFCDPEEPLPRQPKP
jgi:PleD family two-component response regulator